MRTFQPDSTDNMEVGIKGYLLDRQLYLQTAVFQINWNNMQTYFSQSVNDFPVWGTANGPKSTSKGWEFQGRYRLNSAWEANFATTWTKAEMDETKKICLYADGSECRTYNKGGKLGGTAPWKHTLGLRWNHQTDNNESLWASAKARYIGVKASDRGDSISESESVFKYQPYTTVNLSAGISVGKWDWAWSVSNLMNNRELVSFQGTSAVGDRVGARGIYLNPRTIAMNVSYAFN